MMIFHRIGFIIFFLSVSLSVFAQRNTPYSRTFEHVLIPEIPLDSIVYYSANNENAFAYPVYNSIDVVSRATIWSADDTTYSFIAFVAPQALSLNIICKQLHLQKNASITFYNPSKTQVYSFAKLHSGIYASPVISGDTICVLIKEPSTSVSSECIISQISIGFKQFSKENSQLKSSENCELNINCTEGKDWQIEKKSVVKMLIAGTTLCTGTLINNLANNTTPYVLTANHCVNHSAQAATTVFYFNYEAKLCNGSSGDESQVISGSDLIAYPDGYKLDFSLLRLQEKPPVQWGVYYAGWDMNDIASDTVVCIHHPAGDIKKISASYSTPISSKLFILGKNFLQNSQWKVNRWAFGSTEGGSSGSPLFNKQKQLIGTLVGGDATCENPVNDFFSKTSYAWDYFSVKENQLKHWLDPNNTGLKICYGYSPIIASTNILLKDSVYACNFGDLADGFLTSSNQLQWSSVADMFPYLPDSILYAINLVGQINNSLNFDGLVCSVWTGDNKPEELLFSIPIAKDMIVSESVIHVPIPDPIHVNKTIWVGYDFPQNTNPFQVYTNTTNVSFSSMWFKKHTEWYQTSSIGIQANLAIQLQTTNRKDTLGPQPLFQEPYFLKRVSQQDCNVASLELFSLYPINEISLETPMKVVSTSEVSQWSGVNEIHSKCFANSYDLSGDVLLAGMVIGVAENSNPDGYIELCSWDSKLENKKILRKVRNDSIMQNSFNDIVFPVSNFSKNSYVGVCLESEDYLHNLSLAMTPPLYTNMISVFLTENVWKNFNEYKIDNHLAIYPVFAYSQHFFNKDSMQVYAAHFASIDTVDVEQNKYFVIYPNPCINECYISSKEFVTQNISVSVYNSLGNLLIKQVLASHSGKFLLSTQSLLPGMYWIIVESDSVVETLPLLKKKD